MSLIKTTLSVVIIGRNEGERLRRCLESVNAMEPIAGVHEVFYVDSGSDDDSMELAASLGARPIALESASPTAALARNAGWRVASGKWVLFLDGDTILDPAFPRLAIEAVQSENVAVVYGHRRELFPSANFFHRVLDLDWISPLGESAFCGGDALMRRSALEATGGFDFTLIGGEEPELCARLRALEYKILHIDVPMTVHDLAINQWKQYWQRATRTGYAYSQMASRTRDQKIQLWVKESAANKVRATVWIVGVVGMIASMTWAPLIAFSGFVAAAAVLLRSARRSRWKSMDPLTLALYGIHSHLQQIPIFAGQLAFERDFARNQQRGLIEYK